MTHLACFCGARDELPTPPAEPVACWKCGRPMHAWTPPAIAAANTLTTSMEPTS